MLLHVDLFDSFELILSILMHDYSTIYLCLHLDEFLPIFSYRKQWCYHHFCISHLKHMYVHVYFYTSTKMEIVIKILRNQSSNTYKNNIKHNWIYSRNTKLVWKFSNSVTLLTTLTKYLRGIYSQTLQKKSICKKSNHLRWYSLLKLRNKGHFVNII